MAAAFVNDILDTMVDNIEKGLDLDTAMNEAVDSYVPTTDAANLDASDSNMPTDARRLPADNGAPDEVIGFAHPRMDTL